MSQIRSPKGWETQRLGDCCDVVRGSSPRPKGDTRYFGGEIPWIKISDITASAGKYVYSTKEGLTSEGVLKSRFLKSGTLILTTSMLIAMPKILKMDGCIHDGFLAILEIDKKINLDFLYYFFLGYRTKIEQENALGSAIKNINTEVIKNLQISIPSLEIQKKIVQKLDYILGQLEEKKKEILQIINKFDSEKIHSAYQNHLLNLAFSGKLTEEKIIESKDDGIQIPKGWELKKLSEICIINPTKSELNDLSDDTEVSFVPMRYVDDKNGVIDKKETKKLSEVKKGYTYFRENDVIFAKITPCMQNGKSAIGKSLTNGIGFGSTEFHVLRPSKTVLPKWIHYFVRNQSFLDEATNHFTGSAGQQRVPISFLESYAIPIPPLETQKKIVQKLDKKFQEWEKYKPQIQNIEKQYQKTKKSIESITNSVLNSAFSGRLVN